MSDQGRPAQGEGDAPDFGEFGPAPEERENPDTPEARDASEGIPVEQWIPEPVFDSSDYLDRDPPSYIGIEDEDPEDPPTAQGEDAADGDTQDRGGPSSSSGGRSRNPS